MCTSVASRVHGTTGEPCSSAPWWLRMMCSTAPARCVGEAGQVLDQAADAVVAERDLALQLAGVGQVDRQRVGGVGVELADVVQQRAGDGDVAVDARERGRDRRHGLGDGQRVLEQPVAVGLVVALGGRRVAERRPRRRCRRRTPRRAARAGAGSGSCATSSRRSASIWAAARGGPSSSASRSTSSARRRAAASRAICGAVARVDAVAAGDVHGGAGARSARDRATPSRMIAGTEPVRSASAEQQVLATVAPVRSLRSRTSRTPSISCPSVSWRTSMVRNVDPRPADDAERIHHGQRGWARSRGGRALPDSGLERRRAAPRRGRPDRPGSGAPRRRGAPRRCARSSTSSAASPPASRWPTTPVEDFEASSRSTCARPTSSPRPRSRTSPSGGAIVCVSSRPRASRSRARPATRLEGGGDRARQASPRRACAATPSPRR